MENTTETVNPETHQEEQTQPETASREGYVSRADYERIKNDMLKFKMSDREKSEKLRQIEEQTLREKEDWKALAERKAEEAREAAEKAERLQNSFLNREKFSAVERAALKAGIRPDALSDLALYNMDGVVVESTDTGLKVLGAENYIQNLKQLKPYLFGQGAPKVNSSLPDVTAEKEVGTSDLIKLSLEAAKTGDYTKYEAAMRRFQTKK